MHERKTGQAHSINYERFCFVSCFLRTCISILLYFMAFLFRPRNSKPGAKLEWNGKLVDLDWRRWCVSNNGGASCLRSKSKARIHSDVLRSTSHGKYFLPTRSLLKERIYQGISNQMLSSSRAPSICTHSLPFHGH